MHAGIFLQSIDNLGILHRKITQNFHAIYKTLEEKYATSKIVEKNKCYLRKSCFYKGFWKLENLPKISPALIYIICILCILNF